MPKWAVKHIADIAEKTGFTRDRVLDDLLKAGAVALKDRYRAIVTYRDSVEQLWSQPLGKIEQPPIPQPEEEPHVEESVEGVDWLPDLDLARPGNQPQTQSAPVDLGGFSFAQERSGQLAPNPEGFESVEPPDSDSDSGSLG